MSCREVSGEAVYMYIGLSEVRLTGASCRGVSDAVGLWVVGFYSTLKRVAERCFKGGSTGSIGVGFTLGASGREGIAEAV